MDKMLETIISKYESNKMSKAYKTMLKKFCDLENYFLTLLSDSQRLVYLKLESTKNKLNAVETNELANFIYSHCLHS